MSTEAPHSGESRPPTRLYIEGETAEFDGTAEDIVEMVRSVGLDAFVYVPTEADQAAASESLNAQDQAITDLSGALPLVTLDFNPRHNRWDDRDDPLWLLTEAEYARVPDGATLVCISGETAVKGTDCIDQDTRFGCIAWGFLDSQLPPLSGAQEAPDGEG
jgi:hypothetical protein